MPEPSLHGHYAGAVSRLVAYAIDAGVSVTVYALLVSGGIYVVNLVVGTHVSHSDVPAAVWSVGLALWLWLYYGYPWATSGQTPGMAIVGIRVVRRQGGEPGFHQGLVRPPALVLSFATLGLGFIGILIGRERRALQDVLAGTTVVYSWDARQARLRFLARHHDRNPGATPVAEGASN